MSIQAQAAAALDVACGDELTVDGCVARASPAHPSPRLCAQPTHVRDAVLTAQSRSASCDSHSPTRPSSARIALGQLSSNHQLSSNGKAKKAKRALACLRHGV